MFRHLLIALAALLGASPIASAAPIVAIGGSYTVNNGQTPLIGSSIPFTGGLVLTDSGAGSKLPFSVSPVQVTSASDIKFDLSGLTTNPGPITANTSSFTLTGVLGTSGSITFTWSSTPIFQVNSDMTGSVLITGVSISGPNTIPSSDADFSLFQDSNNELRFSVLVSIPNPADPSVVSLAPGAVGNFLLSADPIVNPFGDPIPEPVTLATFGAMALVGGWAARRKLKAKADAVAAA